MAPPPHDLRSKFAHTLSHRESNNARRRLTLALPGSIDFSSNDFLSLSSNPDLQAAFLAELSQLLSPDAPTTAPGIASTGSRLLDGNSTYAESLERELASFHNASTGLLFNSGYAANSGIFSCLPQRGDVVIYDEYIHASVHEGMRLSRAKACLSFAHNSIADFESVLRRAVREEADVRSGRSEVFVAVESVYSMDGDVCPLKELCAVLERCLPRGNGHVVVDEAHATGVFGRDGRGLVCSLGLERKMLVRLHTFGKAMASGGAIVLCDPVIRDYLINYSKSLIYTTALGLPTLAMIRTVYDFTMAGRTHHAQTHLWTLMTHLHTLLATLSRKTPRALLRYISTRPTSPIFSLLTSQPRSLANHCQANSFIVRPIVPPTVPAGGERVRVCLHAGNTVEEIEGLVRCIGEWVGEMQRRGDGVEEDGNGRRMGEKGSGRVFGGDGQGMVLKSRI